MVTRRTKKVKSTGRFGVRYGARLRKRVKKLRVLPKHNIDVLNVVCLKSERYLLGYGIVGNVTILLQVEHGNL